MINDCHVHVTENGKWFNTVYDASLKFALNEMDKSNTSKAVLLPIYGETSNKYVYKVLKTHGDRFFGFGSMSLKTYQNDFHEIIDYGLNGVKFHPRIQHQTIGQWDNEGILSLLESNNKTILICGWQQTSSKIADMSEISPVTIDRVAKKYPNLKIIIAHLGGHNFFDAFFCARSNKNVYLDCSYFFEFFDETYFAKDAIRLIRKLDEKVIYGSDFPEVSMSKYINRFKRISEGLEIDMNKILKTNLLKAI